MNTTTAQPTSTQTTGQTTTQPTSTQTTGQTGEQTVEQPGGQVRADGAARGAGATQLRAVPEPSRVRLRARGRARALVFDTLGKPRFVSQRPPALLEHIAYAASGEWTSEHHGRRRSAALVYAYLVAIPLAALGYLLAWVAARPTRFATFILVATTTYLAVATTLAAASSIGSPR